MTHEEHVHHITPRRTLINVFGGLIVLTIITVMTSRIELGPLNVPLALTIACAKAGLVVWIFMALKWDNRVNGIVFALGVLFLAVFLSFTLMDTLYRGDLSNVERSTVSDMEREEAARSGGDTGEESADAASEH